MSPSLQTSHLRLVLVPVVVFLDLELVLVVFLDLRHVHALLVLEDFLIHLLMMLPLLLVLLVVVD